MNQAHGVLDYAPRPKGGGVRQAAVVIATLIAFMGVGCVLGALAGRLIFKPTYRAYGYLNVQTANKSQAAVLPQQWQLQKVVTTALNSSRQAHSYGLPATASEALSCATLTPIAQTNLLAVSYGATDPAAAALMARKMMDVCIATPATGVDGKTLLVAIEALPMKPDRASQDPAPIFGGLAGAFGGAALFIAWVILRARQRAQNE